MTRSEAAKICQSIKFMMDIEDYSEAVEEALNMAIETLEHEPTAEYSSDVISRQAVLNLAKEGKLLSGNIYKKASDYINELPSADRPTGFWIENDNGTFSCSNCQSWIPKEQHHYARHCLYCGARMESEEE